MEIDFYQAQAETTAIYPEKGTGSVTALSYVTLGLVGEAGEIANKVKKIIRDSNGEITEEKRKELAKEAGDVQWYLAQLATELNSSLNWIALGNLEKLAQRKENNTLKGSGDNR